MLCCELSILRYFLFTKETILPFAFDALIEYIVVPDTTRQMLSLGQMLVRVSRGDTYATRSHHLKSRVNAQLSHIGSASNHMSHLLAGGPGNTPVAE